MFADCLGTMRWQRDYLNMHALTQPILTTEKKIFRRCSPFTKRSLWKDVSVMYEEIDRKKTHLKIVFISNYYNHHQAPLSESLNRLTDGNYIFVETELLEEERKNMGWEVKTYPAFVKKTYLSSEGAAICQQYIDNADVAIIGSAPDSFIETRLKRGALTFRYCERIYKSGYEYYKWPVRVYRNFFRNTIHKNLYLLCASAYTAGDFALTFTFLRKCFNWGYFPEINLHPDGKFVIESKKKNTLLWVARLIDLKHPEVPIEIARRLKQLGYRFELNMIGNGGREQDLKQQIADATVGDCVHLLGSLTPEAVRKQMEQTEVFLFTSDFNEGWGAVLNEAMSSGCAVVASHAIGSVPFLLKHGENGLIYQNGNLDDLFQKVKFLLDHPQKSRELGENAYETIDTKWNADIAASRLITLSSALMGGEDGNILFKEGICAPARILKNNWYSSHPSENRRKIQ